MVEYNEDQQNGGVQEIQHARIWTSAIFCSNWNYYPLPLYMWVRSFLADRPLVVKSGRMLSQFQARHGSNINSLTPPPQDAGKDWVGQRQSAKWWGFGIWSMDCMRRYLFLSSRYVYSVWLLYIMLESLFLCVCVCLIC